MVGEALEKMSQLVNLLAFTIYYLSISLSMHIYIYLYNYQSAR